MMCNPAPVPYDIQMQMNEARDEGERKGEIACVNSYTMDRGERVVRGVCEFLSLSMPRFPVQRNRASFFCSDFR